MKSTIGYLTMAFLPRNLPHAICNTDDQLYPSELKHLFLLYQKGVDGKYPQHIEHDMPFAITQENVVGRWPQLWYDKLAAFLRLTTTDISIIWDEDDRYPPLYTLRMVQALEANPKAGVAWTLQNRNAKRGSHKYFQHTCPIGCAVFRTDFLRHMAKLILKEYPSRYSDGRKRHSKKQVPLPTPNNPTRLSCGALDGQLCKRIEEQYPEKIIVANPINSEVNLYLEGYNAAAILKSTGVRTYVQHGEQNSVMKDANEDLI